MRALKPISD